MAIKITSDRMIDLSNDELSARNISTMPCFVNLGGKSYNDLDDIFPEDVFAAFETRKELAKTAAKSPEHYYDFFLPFVKQGDAVIHFAASSGISAICNNAKIAAQKLKNVYVVDSLTLSNGIALLANFAQDMIAAGETDAKKVFEACLNQRAKVQGSFLIDTLDYLYKGGRCSTLQYFSANILRIKPVIYMDETGHMTTREKYRGNHKRVITHYVETTFEKYPNPDLKLLYIAHACAENELLELIVAEAAKHHTFERVEINYGGCNCAIHSGRNAIGLFFMTK